MESLIIIILLIILLTIWVTSIRRRLLVLDENVDNAMNQIGIQISSRFDVMTTLLNMAKGYADYEYVNQIEIIKAKRSVITAKSSPDDVLGQERAISEALRCVALVAGLYPELKADEGYGRCIEAVKCYEKMVRTSSLIYNDSVAKLNNTIRMIPARLVAGMLGFHQREYLDVSEKDKYII